MNTQLLDNYGLHNDKYKKFLLFVNCVLRACINHYIYGCAFGNLIQNFAFRTKDHFFVSQKRSDLR